MQGCGDNHRRYGYLVSMEKKLPSESSNADPPASRNTSNVNSSAPFPASLAAFAATEATTSQEGNNPCPPTRIHVPLDDDQSCISAGTTTTLSFLPSGSIYPSTEGLNEEMQQPSFFPRGGILLSTPPRVGEGDHEEASENSMQKQKTTTNFLPPIPIANEDETMHQKHDTAPVLQTDRVYKSDRMAATGSSNDSHSDNISGMPAGLFGRLMGFQTNTMYSDDMVNSLGIADQSYGVSEKKTAPPQHKSDMMAATVSGDDSRSDNSPGMPAGLFGRMMGITNRSYGVFPNVLGIPIPQLLPINPTTTEPVLPGAYRIQHLPSLTEREALQWARNTEGDSEQEPTTVDSTVVVARELHLEIATPYDEGSIRDSQGGHGPKDRGVLNRAKLRTGMCLLVAAVAICGVVVLASLADIGIFNRDEKKLKHLQIKAIIEDFFGSNYFDSKQKEKALHWVVYTDPSQGLQTKQDSEANTNNLLQRFILVSFYFQTSSQSPWPYCGPPVEGQSDLCYYDVEYPGSRQGENYASTRWLSAAHECQWMGIQCQRGLKTVSEVSLNQLNLTGVIPSDLSRLSSLTRLDLGHNQLSGPLPTWIDRLSSLESIGFSNNYFSGTVPPEYLKATKLLLLSGNLLTGTFPYGSQASKKNEVIFLGRNLLHGSLPSEIYSMSHLKVIGLSQNNLTGSLSHQLGGLSNISQIDLNGNPLFGGNIPPEISKLKEELRRVNLEGTSITGTIPDSLYSLTNLMKLQLSGSRISGTISSRIGLMTKLQGLSIADTKISGTIPTEISKLSELYSLRINGNSNLVGTIPQNFCSLQLNHRSDIVADCTPSESTGVPAVVCPKSCCSQCCDLETGICLDTP